MITRIHAAGYVVRQRCLGGTGLAHERRMVMCMQIVFVSSLHPNHAVVVDPAGPGSITRM